MAAISMFDKKGNRIGVDKSQVAEFKAKGYSLENPKPEKATKKKETAAEAAEEKPADKPAKKTRKKKYSSNNW